MSPPGAGSQGAGAAAGMAPGRGINAVPSALVTVSQAPAGRPSRSGWACTVTLSPGISEFFLIPARMSALGPSASKPQSVSVPLSSATRTYSHECGFTYSNSCTIPVRVTTLSRSNIAAEWCERADMVPSTRTAAPTAAETNVLIALVLAPMSLPFHSRQTDRMLSRPGLASSATQPHSAYGFHTLHGMGPPAGATHSWPVMTPIAGQVCLRAEGAAVLCTESPMV